MLKNKINFLLVSLIALIIFVQKVSAQGLGIGGSASFNYTSSAGTGKTSAVQDLDDSFTQSYTLNIKNDLTDKGSARTEVRYSIDENIASKNESTDFTVSLDYDIMSGSLSLTDDTESNFDEGVTNSKSTNFQFSISPKVLPKFAFSYRNSIKDSQLTADSNNSLDVQFSKTFKIQNSKLSAAASYSDKSSNSDSDNSLEESTANKFNFTYTTNLLDDKLNISSGYRVGNDYGVSASTNSLTESGDASFGFKVFENLDINGDWSKNKSFNSSDGRSTVNNTNSFRLVFSPIRNLSFSTAVNFNEVQSEDSIKKDKSKDFAVRIPPIFEIINIGYAYNSREESNIISADNSITFDVSPKGLTVSSFSLGGSYSTSKRHSTEDTDVTENESFGFNLSGQPIDRVDFGYSFSLDKTSSNISDDNKDAISNSITVGYGLMLIEDLNSSIGVTYDQTENVSPISSSSGTSSSYNASLDYNLGVTNISFSGSLTRTFDDSGTHVSQRTDFGPGISTKFMGVSLATQVSFGTSSTEDELTSSSNTNYSIDAGYPIGTIGESSINYSVTKQENLTDASANSDDEQISMNLSFSF